MSGQLPFVRWDRRIFILTQSSLQKVLRHLLDNAVQVTGVGLLHTQDWAGEDKRSVAVGHR
jgi:hypothetical protein